MEFKVKVTLVLMLLAALIPFISLILSLYMLGQGIPVFVYIFPIGWIVLFLYCFKNLKYGMLVGIIWGIVNVIGPIAPVLAGVPNPLANALEVSICPFAVLSVVISLIIIYLCYSSYKGIKR